MAETLEMWLGRMLREVEQDGNETATLLLQAGEGGQTWDRWDKPLRENEGGPGPRNLATIIEEVILNAAEDWPAKKTHMVMLVALDGHGNDRGRWVKHIKGKNQNASSNMLASESVQHANAMQMHAETSKVLLSAANHQVVLQQQTIEMLLKQTQDIIGLFVQQKLEHSLAQDEQSSEIQKEMWETFKGATPQLLELAAHALASRSPAK